MNKIFPRRKRVHARNWSSRFVTSDSPRFIPVSPPFPTTAARVHNRNRNRHEFRTNRADRSLSRGQLPRGYQAAFEDKSRHFFQLFARPRLFIITLGFYASVRDRS